MNNGKTMMGIGALLAACGPVACQASVEGGSVLCLVGLLLFGVGRFMKSQS